MLLKCSTKWPLLFFKNKKKTQVIHSQTLGCYLDKNHFVYRLCWVFKCDFDSIYAYKYIYIYIYIYFEKDNKFALPHSNATSWGVGTGQVFCPTSQMGHSFV